MELGSEDCLMYCDSDMLPGDRKHRPDDVLGHLLKTRGLKLRGFVGALKMSDEEVEDFKKGLKGFWSRWK